MTGTKVSLTVEAGTAWITLDGPERRNALDAQAARDLAAICDTIDADPATGVAVITGTGRAFCSGADTAILNGIRTASPDRAYDGLDELYAGFRRFAGLKVPTVAAVNGAAVGAGMNMALGCDVRVAGASARFDTRFLTLGLHPGGGHTWMMRRVIGPQEAAAMVLFGEVADGAEAERIGLVHRCVPDGELLAITHAMAAKAADAPRELAITVKQTLRDMADVGTHEAAVDRELEPQVWSTQQPWFKERLARMQARISGRKG